MSSTCTDTFNFSDHKLFQSIKDILPVEKEITQDLLDCKDDILFVWNSKDSNLISLNWRAAKVKGFDVIKYQTLTPTAVPNFTVDKVLVSNGAQFVALSGKRGVAMLELPRRWGTHGQFQDGKENIICQSAILDEYFFNNNTSLEILQVRWHPGSPTDTHLLVLLSDNSIRVYDEYNLKHVWRTGPIPNITALEKNSSFLNSLGDTAVDFDIAPPRVITTSSLDINESLMSLSLLNSSNISLSKTRPQDQKRVEWPIVILRGDGSIFILKSGLDTEKPRLEGPLTMYPEKLDNYGLDSCSLIVIPTLPPTVVIAENTGKIHHALLVESEDDFNETTTFIGNEYDLHVLETIELELGLMTKKKGKEISCPIHLKRYV
jgi:nuclear pore complex protein Nup88